MTTTLRFTSHAPSLLLSLCPLVASLVAGCGGTPGDGAASGCRAGWRCACATRADCPDPYAELCDTQAGECVPKDEWRPPDDATPDPDDEPASRFDPGRVYLWGTLSEGACYRDAVAALSNPDEGYVGFPCGLYDRAIIRPTDGALLYYDSEALAVRRFGVDRTMVKASRLFDDGYPERPLANDPATPIPACAVGRGARSFHVLPDTGALVFACGDGPGQLVDAGGRTVASYQDEFVAVGRDGMLLTHARGILKLETSEGLALPLMAVPAFAARIVARAGPSGFLVATWDTFDAPTILWRVRVDGTWEDAGTYPLDGERAPHDVVMDGDGALYGFASEHFTDVVKKYTAGAAQPELAYSEATDPLVKVHGSGLFTGP